MKDINERDRVLDKLMGRPTKSLTGREVAKKLGLDYTLLMRRAKERRQWFQAQERAQEKLTQEGTARGEKS